MLTMCAGFLPAPQRPRRGEELAWSQGGEEQVTGSGQVRAADRQRQREEQDVRRQGAASGVASGAASGVASGVASSVAVEEQAEQQQEELEEQAEEARLRLRKVWVEQRFRWRLKR